MARTRSDTDVTGNKQIVQQFFDTVVNQRNVDALSQFVREDGTCGGATFQQMVVDPSPIRIGVSGTDRIVPKTERGGERDDVAAFSDFTAHVLEAFPDLQVKIESMIAEGDQVAVRWTATGTHRGEFLGTPATGRTVPMTNVDIFTLEDGKIVGVDAHPDSAGVLHALGHLPDTPLAATLAAGVREQR